MTEVSVEALAKAQTIVQTVIEHRARWGRHAGFAEFSEHEVLDALVVIGEAGFLESELGDDLRAALTAANRAKGAAEARERKYKGQLDDANENIRSLTIALEEAEEENEQLRTQLHESLDA